MSRERGAHAERGKRLALVTDQPGGDGPQQSQTDAWSLLASSRAIEFIARAALLAAALYSFSTGLKLYQGSGIWGPAVTLGLGLYVLGAGCLIAAFVIGQPMSRRAISGLGIVLLVATVVSVAYEIDFSNPTYGTDAIAFAHASGELLIQGQNPYAEVGGSLGDVVDRFRVSESFVTRTNTGQSVERLVSYPAGHVVAYSAGLAVGLDDLRSLTLVFEVAGLTLIWLVVSPIARLFIPFALLMDDNLTVFFTSGGVTDWVWVLPLVATAVFLNRERYGYAGIALGIACAMKQQPWFLMPFALIWVWQTPSRDERVSRREGTAAFLTGTGAGFLFLNLPFMVWSLPDWWAGVMHPLFGDLVPDGQGFSMLASRGLLPIPGEAYTAGLAILTALLLWGYARWFGRMQNLLWVLPPVLLLLSHRSFHSYFIYWVPLALLWLDLRINGSSHAKRSVAAVTSARETTSRNIVLIGVVVAAVLGVAVIAPGSSAPLDVGQVEATVANGVVESLHVEVLNRTDHSLTPVLEVYWRGQAVPWSAVTEDRIQPGETLGVTIVPLEADGIPPITQDGSGLSRVVDFRVRVNESGSSVYSSSAVVSTPLPDSLVNPLLESWTREDSVFAAPYGWRPGQQGGSEDQRSATPLEDLKGASLRVAAVGAGPSDWIETALLQDVPSFDGCYRWDFTHNVEYTTDHNGSPLAVGGVQFVQGESSVWFVPSDVVVEWTTTLSDGTRIVEVPSRSGVATTAILDVGAHAPAVGLDRGARGTVKIFNAVHQTIAADSVLEISRLEPVACT
jgi:uncharacterized membrane protein